MTNSYQDLVNQTFNFPQEGFDVTDGYLRFNGVDVKALIDKYDVYQSLMNYWLETMKDDI